MRELVLEQFLPYVMARFAERLSTGLATIYQQEYDITTPEWRVLANLRTSGELMSKDIALRTNMDKVKVSRAVQTLIDRKWIRKKDSKEDSRAYFLLLTAKGEKVMAKLIPQALDWQADLLTSVSKKDLAALLQTIEQLDQQLESLSSKP